MASLVMELLLPSVHHTMQVHMVAVVAEVHNEGQEGQMLSCMLGVEQEM